MKFRHSIIVFLAVLVLFLSVLACGTATINDATRSAVISILGSIATQGSFDSADTLAPTQLVQPTDILLPTETPLPIPTLGMGSTIVNPVDGAVMVYVPAGEFIMGSDDLDTPEHEKPALEIFLDAFWVYQTEVTNGQFSKFVDATHYVTTAEKLDSVPFFRVMDWMQWKFMMDLGRHQELEKTKI